MGITSLGAILLAPSPLLIHSLSIGLSYVVVFFLWYNKDSKPREVILLSIPLVEVDSLNFLIVDTGNIYHQSIQTACINL